MLLGQLDTHTEKKNRHPYIISYTKISFKWSGDVNGKNKKVKGLEDNIERYLRDLGISKHFLKEDTETTNNEGKD